MNKSKIWIGSLIIFTTLSLLFIQSCKKDKSDSPWTIPSITTGLLEYTETTADVSGDITSDGGTPVTESGICWGTNDNPTIDDSKTSDGTDSGFFSSKVTGLITNTKYYVRAYATNIEGTGYGETVSFTTKGSFLVTVNLLRFNK
jgi:hypothetical protein